MQAWKVNIQPVFNHYKAVTYMCAYFSKTKNEISKVIKQVAIEVACQERQLEKKRAVAKLIPEKGSAQLKKQCTY